MTEPMTSLMRDHKTNLKTDPMINHMVDSMNIPQIKTKNMTFIMNIKSLFQIVTSGRFRTLAIFFDGGQSVLKTPAVWQTCSLSNFS